MKSKLDERDVFIFFILQNKLRFAEYQPKLQKKNNISATMRLTISMVQLNDMIIVDIRTARLNEKALNRHHVILNSMTFRLLINRIMELKRSYLDSHEFMTV